MPGLDPGIHPSSQESVAKEMDCRVKPGNDEFCEHGAQHASLRARHIYMLVNNPDAGDAHDHAEPAA
jgi:hypothetical protein